ncbi:MAG TPA: TonB-dependent receptor [Steroidobacteraceae bacterium]|nr:TonB-dependent receptor [Steroidobacteraceae bacterium]
MSSNFSVRQAVGLALGTAGAAAASLNYASAALAADTTGPAATPDTTLAEVVVTGSRIRRVDAETANPIQVIDSTIIQESGITTVGDLVQRIPSVSGRGTNPGVNNGGGFGESNIELRGLDAKRTLILVDGRRVGMVGFTQDAIDVNQIPINMIDHIEVLKEGAGAIYGSDAIGGVVNFITRKDVEGLEISGDYGRTGHSDGAHHSANVLFGTNTDKFNLMMGGSYLSQDQVSAGNRNYSKYALYLYGASTGVTRGGSSRVPTGRIFTNPLGLKGSNGKVCSSLTRIASTDGSTLADYRCYNSPADNFNYQPLNLIQTPIERASFFSKANYKINDDVEAYASITDTHTHSGFLEAPLPFDSLNDNITLSKNSIYNPFGQDFGGNSGANPDFTLRTFLFGQRRSDSTGDSADFNGGLKGNLWTTGWKWDLNLTYSRLHQHELVGGYYFASKLNPAVGPSYIDPATGQPTCGTPATATAPAAPIAGCTPVNLFDQFNNTAAALSGISANYNIDYVYFYKAVDLDFTGTIWTLPAGDLQAAVGAEYNDRRGNNVADAIVQSAPPLYLTCGLSQETCTGNAVGKYDSKQEYIEIFAPILKDLPFVHSLNADIGARHNHYSLFGSSTKSDFKVEYRPVKDLLIRGTFSQVLRVPTINDLYSSPVNTSVTFNDPCNGLTAAKAATNPNYALACKGVPLDGTFKEPNGQITGLNASNPTLKPETGKVKTAGFVFEPSFVPGFSLEADYWNYHIDGLIKTLDSNYSINQCLATGSPTFCGLVTRYGAGTGTNAGQVLVFVNPSFNLGTLDTSGADIDLKYTIRNTPIGSFQASLDWTHTNNYTSKVGGTAAEIAGTYDKQFGNYTKNRGQLSVGWTWLGVDALLSGRYIGSLRVPHPSVTGKDANGNPYPDLQIGSTVYEDLTVGYTIAATKTHVQVGVRNISDKQPPLFYQNNVTNANTDVETYDLLGRQWFVGFTQKL